MVPLRDFTPESDYKNITIPWLCLAELQLGGSPLLELRPIVVRRLQDGLVEKEGRCTTAQVTLWILPAWEGVEEWVSCANHHRYHFLQSQRPGAKDRSLGSNKQKTKTSKQTFIYGAEQPAKYIHNSAYSQPSRSPFVSQHNKDVKKKWKEKSHKKRKNEKRAKTRTKKLISPKIGDEKKGLTKQWATGTPCAPNVFARTVAGLYICRWQETVQGCFIENIVEAPIEIYPTCSSSISWDPVSVTAKKFLNSW